MSRPLRISYPGAFYHVTSRGNEGKTIFHTPKDFERFIGYQESATERYGARIHCFCLMTNHYHLLLETPRANLQVILHHINTSYTNYFNAKKGRVGHLFQGRYRAILVDKDSYLLELSRYIHLNPVRARLVDDPSKYRWSSYLAYEKEEKRWNWLCTNFILEQVSKDGEKASILYRNYVLEGMRRSLENPLKNTIASTILGSDKFVEWVREKWVKKASSHRDIPALKRLASWPDLSTILKESERVFGRETSESRRIALYLSHRLSGLPLGEIGNFFEGISPSAVSQTSRRLEKELKDNSELSKQIDQLKQSIMSKV